MNKTVRRGFIVLGLALALCSARAARAGQYIVEFEEGKRESVLKSLQEGKFSLLRVRTDAPYCLVEGAGGIARLRAIDGVVSTEVNGRVAPPEFRGTGQGADPSCGDIFAAGI